MARRPFFLLPRVTRTPQLGWTYIRWGRRLWLVAPRVRRGGRASLLRWGRPLWLSAP